MSDPVNIDAEYMNIWLGNSSKIKSLSPKVLYDIKTLLEYYKDIIVPQAEVAIAFPVEGKDCSPRASVERGEVMIPYHMLQDGEVDNTIGAMIHELHHIKLSASERFLTAISFKFLRQLMDQIQIGSMTMAERLFTDASISADKIMGWGGHEPLHTNDMKFLREALMDMLFMINAVEDVRIDANTPPNLRKYITKLEKGASKAILDKIESGEFHNDLRDISSIAFMLLVHHKDIAEFPFIEDRYGDTDAIISSDATELPLSVFSAFTDEIANHIEERYYAYCGKPKETKKDAQGNDTELDLDAYFGGKVKSSVGEAVDEQFSETIQSDVEYKALETQDAKIKEVNVSTGILPHQSGGSGVTGTDTLIDLSENDNKDLLVQQVPPAFDGRELRKEIEEQNKVVHLDPTVVTQINSFKDVQVITTSEHFQDQEVVYDSVLFDAV